MAGVIAVTGANGFVGRQVGDLAPARQAGLRPLTRRELGDLGGAAIDPRLLAGCSAIIHTAARAHRMGEQGVAALAAYRQTNVAGTQALIAAMVQAGVRRLVFVSSIKTLGERSRGAPLRPQDACRPEDPYGVSKAEAEAVVLAAQAAGQIDAVIVRPVLVHGPGVKGNLQRLLGAIARGRALPLGAVRNRRSMLGVGNLADALLTAAVAGLTTPGRAGREDGRASGPRSQVYHLADGVISTRRLVEVLAEGLGVQPRLINLPRWLAVGGATLLGRGAMARRLFDDLEVDDSDFRRDFAWQPKLGLEAGLRLMAEDFTRRQRDGIPG